MVDVSDIVRHEPRMFATKPRPQDMRFNIGVHAGTDMFRRPSMVGMAELKLKMFNFTMKKRKFPFERMETAEAIRVNPEEQEIEQTRRLSDFSVSTWLCLVVIRDVDY